MNVSGVSMTAKPEVITGTMRLLRDRMLVLPLDWTASDTIIAIRTGRAVRGKVIAIGPGEYPRLYNHDKSKVWDSKVFKPTQVRPGDIVELGGLNVFDGLGYQFVEVIYDGVKHLICTEKDVCGVVATSTESTETNNG